MINVGTYNHLVALAGLLRQWHGEKRDTPVLEDAQWGFVAHHHCGKLEVGLAHVHCIPNASSLRILGRLAALCHSDF
jgi:hypothetical protein